MRAIPNSNVNGMQPLAVAITAVLFTSGCGPDLRTVVHTDKAARAPILATGVTLPTSATDLYYAFQPQFSDYIDTWISFSADAADCVSAAQAAARTKTPTPTFVAGTQSPLKRVTGGAAYHHPEFASPRWDLSTVRNGTMFETNGLFVLIDTDKNRTYIAMRRPQ
jgi:hypothetical protein